MLLRKGGECPEMVSEWFLSLILSYCRLFTINWVLCFVVNQLRTAKSAQPVSLWGWKRVRGINMVGC